MTLADQIVKLLHGALASVMYLSTSSTHVQALFRWMSFAVTLLAHPSLLPPKIDMPVRSAVGARFNHHEAMRTDFHTLLTQIRTLISQILHAI